MLASMLLLLGAGFGDYEPTVAQAASSDLGAGAPTVDDSAEFQPPTQGAQETHKPLAESEAKVATDRFNSARVCGACHQEIFEHWSRSMHALSYKDPIFKAAFLKAYYYTGGEAAALCLRCHSPTTIETKDFLGRQEITREGITCDYCHSISGITQTSGGQTLVTIDHTARHSPFEQRGRPPAPHAVQWRGYFARSEMCASCHDYTAPTGVAVFSTYSEWSASHHKRDDKQCQQCHMPRLSGEGHENRSSAGNIINDHNLVGGHSPAQLKRAVTAGIQEIARDGDRVRVVVTIENSGAGHYVPTGLPSKTLVMGVTATQRNRAIFRQEVVYQRIMQGEDQHPLVDDWQIKLLSKYVLRDNRLRPGETRRETFVFDAMPNDDVIVQVEVTYRYKPKLDSKQWIKVPIASLEQVLVRGP